MAQRDRTNGQLRAGSLVESDLVVLQVSGRERLSAPYRFQIDLRTAEGAELALEDLVGQDAVLTLTRTDGTERKVHGLVLALELTGVSAGQPLYRAVLGPRLATLAHLRRSRVFQDLAVPDLAQQLLDDAGISYRTAVSRSHPPREYTVQHRESDLDFLQRVLAADGIFYWFEHSDDGHVLVLADDGASCGPIEGDPELPYRDSQRHGDEAEYEHLFQLGREHAVRPGKTALRDYDFERPLMDVVGQAADGAAALGLEWYRYPGGFRDPGAGGQRSRAALEELRFEAESFAGEGTCLRFLPGFTFRPSEHRDAAYDRDLLLVEVRHTARFQRAAGMLGGIEHGYWNSFTASDAGRPCRPAAAVRPPVAFAETATVVGPPGEEVHTDQHGRVKVRFHWDREGPNDDRAGCFLRVAQSWAGPGFGGVVLPRVGQEVVVRFLEGDPDRPLVIGAVHNGRNPPPLALPGERTRSTFRSETSPGGGGANELRLEDQSGAEEVHLHAQRDTNVEVVNDRATRVGASETRNVGQDRTAEVHGYQRTRVGQDDATQVSGNQITKVSVHRATSVIGKHAETVSGGQTATVSGARHRAVTESAVEEVLLASSLKVGAIYAVNVGAAENVAVGGVLSRQVAGASKEYIGAAREETVGGSSSSRVGGDHDIAIGDGVLAETVKDQAEDVGGKAGIQAKDLAGVAAKEVRLEADKLTVVVGGQVSITMDRSGVKIAGSLVTVKGSGAVALKGKPVEKSGPGSAGSASPSVRKLTAKPEEHAFVDLELVDSTGAPVANEWFRVEFPDGKVKEGRLDGAGKARVPGAKKGKVKVSFPRLHGDAWRAK